MMTFNPADLSFEDLNTNPLFEYSKSELYFYQIWGAKNGTKFFENGKTSLFIIQDLNDDKPVRCWCDRAQNQINALNNSSQNASSINYHNSQNNFYLTDYIFANDPRDIFYLVSENKIDENILLDNPRGLFLIEPVSGIEFKQHKKYINSPDAWKKTKTGFNAIDLFSRSMQSQSKYKILRHETIQKISFENEDIKINTDGWIGNVEIVDFDKNNNSRFERELFLDNTKNYIGIQADCRKLTPNLICQSPTFDINKILPYNFLTSFFGNKVSLLSIFDDLKDLSNPAASDLYEAILTCFFISKNFLEKYKDYRVAAIDNVNFNKINIDSSKLFGLAIDDELSQNPGELNATILTFWENKHVSSIETDPKIEALWNRIKAFLSACGHFCPNPYAYGLFDDINKLSSDFYFDFDLEYLKISSIKDHENILGNAFSKKYLIDRDAKKIVGFTSDFLKISSLKTFNLKNKISFPSHPDRFIEKNGDTRPSNSSLSPNDIFSYQWFRNLKSNYATIFNSTILDGQQTTNSRNEVVQIPGNNYDEIGVYFQKSGSNYVIPKNGIRPTNSNTFKSGTVLENIFGEARFPDGKQIAGGTKIKFACVNRIWNTYSDNFSLNDFLNQKDITGNWKNASIVVSPTKGNRLFPNKQMFDLKIELSQSDAPNLVDFVKNNYLINTNQKIDENFPVKATIYGYTYNENNEAYYSVKINPSFTITDGLPVTFDSGSIDSNYNRAFLWTNKINAIKIQFQTITEKNAEINNNPQLKFPYNLDQASFLTWKQNAGENDDTIIIKNNNIIAENSNTINIAIFTLHSTFFELTLKITDNKNAKNDLVINCKTSYNYDQSIIHNGLIIVGAGEN